MTKSEALYAEAVRLMPGGVNSPVRAFQAVGGTPVYFVEAREARLIDVDGREYIDYVSSWGAILLGHAHPAVTEAISSAARHGTSFGACHPGEIDLASEVLRRTGHRRVRFVNSGTEAALAVIRLARAATGKEKIVKFAGNYHGAVDALLAQAGSGVATFGIPDSAGVPQSSASATLVAEYNNLENIDAILEANRGEIAAILVEPVAGNMGLVPPEIGFLEGLRERCDRNGALLVFDEVMTGFRVGWGGAAARYGVASDLSLYAKVIGGGLPVGAYAGREDLMDQVAPLGPVYQAGTLSGNPLAMAAGSAVLALLQPPVYMHLEAMGARLEAGLQEALQRQGVPGFVQRVGSMISVFFTSHPVRNYGDAAIADRERFARVFHGLLKRGIYLPPSALEAWFLNAAHTESDIDETVNAFGEALAESATGQI